MCRLIQMKVNVTRKSNKFLSSLNYNWNNHGENVYSKKIRFYTIYFYFFTLLYFLFFIFFYFNFNLVFYLDLEAESKAYIFLGPVFVVHGLKRFHLASK